jgi:hypothetical protein
MSISSFAVSAKEIYALRAPSMEDITAMPPAFFGVNYSFPTSSVRADVVEEQTNWIFDGEPCPA